MSKIENAVDANRYHRWNKPNARSWMRPDAHRWIEPISKAFEQNGYQCKYDPAQPRVPAGNPGGGQWSSNGDSDLFDVIFAAAQRLAVAGPGNYQRCLNLCYPLLERYQPAGSDANTWAFQKCMNACLGRSLYQEGGGD